MLQPRKSNLRDQKNGAYGQLLEDFFPQEQTVAAPNPQTLQDVDDLLEQGALTPEQAALIKRQMMDPTANQGNQFGEDLFQPTNYLDQRQAARGLFNPYPNGLNPGVSSPAQAIGPTAQQGASEASTAGQDMSGSPVLFPDSNPGIFNSPTARAPQTLEEVDQMYQNGELTPDQANSYEASLSNPQASTPPTTDKRNTGNYIDENGNLVYGDQSDYNKATGTAGQDQNFFNNVPLINPWGTDIGTELYGLGRAIGAPRGTRGRTAGIVGGAGAALLDAAGTVASGIGYEKMNRYVQDYNRKKRQEKIYTAASQTPNANYLGGLPTGRDGGLFKFEDGGFMGPADQSVPDQSSDVSAQVSQALQQGTEPQQIVKSLVDSGMDPQQAEQIVMAEIQKLQQQMAQPSEQQPMAEAPAPEMQDQQVMSKGGKKVTWKPGDTVEFRYGGKMVKGKVKEVKNNKIYLY